jgi:hypothetical protein
MSLSCLSQSPTKEFGRGRKEEVGCLLVRVGKWDGAIYMIQGIDGTKKKFESPWWEMGNGKPKRGLQKRCGDRSDGIFKGLSLW